MKQFCPLSCSHVIGCLLQSIGCTIDDVGSQAADAIMHRCVVMVGMPYPNRTDPELLARVQYMEQTDAIAGKEFYEDLCMKVCPCQIHP